MDPDVALANLRSALKQCDESGGENLDALADAVDAFEALDDWLKRGGFLPESWRKARNG